MNVSYILFGFINFVKKNCVSINCISGKWRTSSDPITNKAKKLQGRLRMCQKHEKSEVPDIIEGVPVCSGDHTRTSKRYNNTQTDLGRVVFQIPNEGETPDR